MDSVPAAETRPDEPGVHEAFGPTLGGLQAGAVIALGVISLLPAGVLSIMLGALVNEHRLSESGIGLAAATEALTMAASTGLAGALLKPVRLRLIAIAASLLVSATDGSTVLMHGNGLILLRAAAGLPEGILLWIAIGMVVRTVTPERWSAVLLTTLTAVQVGVSAIISAVFVPRFGANGGFAVLAAASACGVGAALLIPSRYAPLPRAEGESGAPPARGWLALAATVVFGAAFGAVSIYTVPLAVQAGLDPGVGNFAVTLSLGAQVLGGTIATLMAGRIRYFVVFVGGTIAWSLTWLVYGLHSPAWAFLAATFVGGVVLLFVSPFYVPMTIEADPTRRAAVQSGAAQLLSGALGPLLAALVVGDHDVHGALWLGVGLLLAGLALSGALHFTARPELANSATA
jgi:hypothetical protein